jgi:hypothetical protein
MMDENRWSVLFPTHFLIPTTQNWPLSGPANSLGRGRIITTSSTEAAGCTIDAAQDSKEEILI